MNSSLTKWTVPAFFLGAGVACVVAAGVGGRLITGLVLLGTMAACSLILILLARRSETYRGLIEGTDERFALIGERAWAGTGFVLTLANLGELIANLAAGRSGSPYYVLLGIAAAVYVGLVVLFRRVS